MENYSSQLFMYTKYCKKIYIDVNISYSSGVMQWAQNVFRMVSETQEVYLMYVFPNCDGRSRVCSVELVAQ